jgi:hypothetical protein
MFGLMLVLGIGYGAVRAVVAGASLLAGGRFRGYRGLAARYRGKYEYRGMVDPPTVSFFHNGSSIRVGLAPVVPGQVSPPRTRVVMRFGEGLPFRLELMPLGRPSPPQAPKGTRPVVTGHAEFDRGYLVRANDPEIARAFLDSDGVRGAIDGLRKLAPPAGALVSISPERLLVQVDRNLGHNAGQLDQVVRRALVIHDGLVSSVRSRLREGVTIVAAGPAAGDDADGPPMCEVCGDPIEGPHVVCVACRTPFHKDCWVFVAGCSTFGCRGKQSEPAPVAGGARAGGDRPSSGDWPE